MGTAIEWTDETWNPVTGCTKVSPGCDHCYAERVTERFHGKGSFERVVLHSDRLHKPYSWRKPRRVFVNSMSDLFHEAVPDRFIADVFAVMALNERHTFQILTKRHGRMRSLLNDRQFLFLLHHAIRVRGDLPLVTLPLPNVWLGVSVEDQKWADIRIPALLDTPAAVRFLSCEPLLGPLDLHGKLDASGSHRPRLTYWLTGRPGFDGPDGELTVSPRIDWVIVGGESGPGARPMHPGWARDLRDQCWTTGVPFLMKQWGEWALVDPRDARTGDVWVLGENGTTHSWRSDTAGAEAHRWGEHADALMRRAGKKAAGRELDGRTWDEYPEQVAVIDR